MLATFVIALIGGMAGGLVVAILVIAAQNGIEEQESDAHL